MADIDDEVKHNLRILKALNKAIEEGPWEESLFYQAMQKKLVQMRDRFKTELKLGGGEHAEHEVPATLAGRIAMRSGLIEVFVLLYNSQGENIVKWEGILSTLDQQIISRPIYRYEKPIKAVLRNATHRENEAYVGVYIHEDDILQPEPEKTPKDRMGNELLVLREKSVTKENITRFIHISGQYEYENSKLVWQGAAEFVQTA